MSSKSDDVAIRLARVEVLRDLPQPLRVALARQCTQMAVPKDRAIFLPGDAPGMHVVLRGRVVILTRPSPEAEVELFDRRSGEVFGEISLFLNQQVNEARAAEPAFVLRIDAGALHSALRQSQPATLALAALVANRMVLAQTRLGEVALHKVKDRLQRLLEHLAEDSGIADSRGYLIRDRLTHEELARMLGAGRVAVTRALGELRREGQVTTSGHRLVVPSKRSF